MPSQGRKVAEALAAKAKKAASKIKLTPVTIVNSRKGVAAAGFFLLNRIREAVSKKSPLPPLPAVPGAPPRLRSGSLRDKLYFRQTGPWEIAVESLARSRKGFNYPKHLEEHGHAFVRPTVIKYMKELQRISGGKIKVRYL